MALTEQEEMGIRGIQSGKKLLGHIQGSNTWESVRIISYPTVLAFMETSSICKLLLTITNGIVKTSEPQEAINDIIRYCKGTMDVLKRKRVTKDLLYRYLHQNGNAPKSDKIEMIRQCTKLWERPDLSDLELAEYKDWDLSESDDESLVVQPKPVIDKLLHDMGITFVKWFYGLLREFNNPNHFGSHIFWSNCSLVWKQTSTKDQNDTFTTSHQGSVEICDLIRNNLKTSGLSFKPKTHDDPKTILDTSGLVTIEVGGFVCRYGKICGVFTHKFGLIEDQSSEAYNWKIKSIYMDHNVSPPSEFCELTY